MLSHSAGRRRRARGAHRYGVDAMYEITIQSVEGDGAKHVMVEINLTSNDVILGVSGRDHLSRFTASTASRLPLDRRRRRLAIKLTHEYVRAAEAMFALRGPEKYGRRDRAQLFPGASLWREADASHDPSLPACATRSRSEALVWMVAFLQAAKRHSSSGNGASLSCI